MKKFWIMLSVFTLFSATVYAGNINPVIIDRDTRTISVTGEIGENFADNDIICIITDADTNVNSLDSIGVSALDGIYTESTDENGNYRFDIKFKSGTGRYKAVVGGTGGMILVSEPFKYYNPDDVKTLLGQIETARKLYSTNPAESAADIKRLLDEELNRDMLGINTSFYGITYEDIDSSLLNILASHSTPYEGAQASGEFLNAYGEVAAVQAFNNLKEKADVRPLIDECDNILKLNTEDVYTLYLSAAYKDSIDELIVNGAFDSIDGVKSFFTDMTLLAENAGLNNWSQFDDFISKYNKYINLDLTKYSKNKKVISEAMVGKKFDSMGKFKEAYAAAVKSASGNTGSDSGNSGTAKTPSKTSRDNNSTVNLPNTSGNTTSSFSDIGSAEWAKKAIETLAAKKIINGKSNNLFAPHDSITRKEAVAMLVRAFDINPGNANAEFSDLTSDDWSYTAVAAAVNAGIINGYENNTFGGNRNISREEFAVIISRVIAYKQLIVPSKNPKVDFTDGSEIAGYARESVDTLQTAGIINGMGDGSFAPKGECSRAQAAVMIYNTLNMA